MKIKITKFQTAFTMFLAVFISLAGLSSSVRADVVTDWNAIAVQATITGARPGPSGVIDVAMVHGAVYDAIQAIEGKYEPYYVDIPGASGSSVAAAAKAAHDVLVSRFPAQSAAIGVSFQNYLLAQGIPADDPGIAVGALAAAGIIAVRSCDGSFPNPVPPPFIGGTGIGVWRPTAPANSPMSPGPWLGAVTPFTLTRPSQFRSQPPPELNSRQYARDYNEVKSMGALNNSERSPEQTDQAHFWAGNFGVMLNKLVRDMSDEHVDNIADSSRLFALTSMAQADAIITVWNDKAHYVFWRPVTAIQNGDLDGNHRTAGDPAWTSLIASPPYPDHSSGANGITSATMSTLKNFFRRDRMDFSVTTTNVGPTNEDTREFRRFSDAAEEVVDARIYLGIHFRFADEASRTLGIKVADWGYRNYMRAAHRHGYGDHFVAPFENK
ncbi:MAG: vanadium-dependent haloperoxidase [Saprospiraceae bacterium]|nr:vanadium-dependent haloperoxidase [Pyrinomonadaceae bacterium]